MKKLFYYMILNLLSLRFNMILEAYLARFFKKYYQFAIVQSLSDVKGEVTLVE